MLQPLLHARRAPAFGWTAAFLFLIAVTGTCVLLLSMPRLFAGYYPLFNSDPIQAGDATAIVSWLQTSQPPALLNARLSAGALMPMEVDHFADVRSLFKLVRWVTALAWIAVTAFCLLVRPPHSLLATAAKRAGLLGSLLAAAAFTLALLDWRLLFKLVHAPFFESDTWRFPTFAYSIRLFPRAFWQQVAAAAGILTLALLYLSHLALRWQSELRNPTFPNPKPETRNSPKVERL